MSLRVAIYASPWRSILKPTGVGQHVAQMSAALAKSDDVEPSLLATRDDFDQVRGSLPFSLADAQVAYLPGRERLTRLLMLGTPLLPVEKYCGDIDWVYSPKEQPVATRRARLAVTVHDVRGLEDAAAGGSASRLSRARWHALMKQVLRRADLIATVSEFTRRRLIELYRLRDDSRLVVVGNGIGAGYFRRPSRDDLTVLERFGVVQVPYLCLVGSLTHRKGGDLILQLAQRLLEQKQPHRILISGRRHDPELLTRYTELKGRLPDLPVDLLGYVGEADQAVLLSHAVALLFPSRYEGFGIPVLEAMAAGTPVICSRNGALPEVAGDAALFLDSESIDEMLQAVRHVADSSNGREALIEAGRRRAAGYTWEACSGKLLRSMQAH